MSDDADGFYSVWVFISNRP